MLDDGEITPMSVLLRLDGVDELARADQRRVGRALREALADSSSNEFAGATVVDGEQHPSWEPGQPCPECNVRPDTWTVDAPDGEVVIGARCADCGRWLKRTPALAAFLDPQRKD